jgi:hypothetical protein
MTREELIKRIRECEKHDNRKAVIAGIVAFSGFVIYFFILDYCAEIYSLTLVAGFFLTLPLPFIPIALFALIFPLSRGSDLKFGLECPHCKRFCVGGDKAGLVVTGKCSQCNEQIFNFEDNGNDEVVSRKTLHIERKKLMVRLWQYKTTLESRRLIRAVLLIAILLAFIPIEFYINPRSWVIQTFFYALFLILLVSCIRSFFREDKKRASELGLLCSHCEGHCFQGNQCEDVVFATARCTQCGAQVYKFDDEDSLESFCNSEIEDFLSPDEIRRDSRLYVLKISLIYLIVVVLSYDWLIWGKLHMLREISWQSWRPVLLLPLIIFVGLPILAGFWILCSKLKGRMINTCKSKVVEHKRKVKNE